MEFSVPQFIEVEDKIIGPLTLKQFFMLLGGALITFAMYTILGKGVIFFFLDFFVWAILGAITFVKFNGRPLLANAPSLMRFYLTPKYRVFKRISDQAVVVSKKEEAVVVPEKAATKPEVGSRLKKLAYLLDQKTAEEERLIHSGEMKGRWLNQV